MDIFYRWVWDEFGRYTSDITHDHADGWLRHLAQRDCCYKVVRMLLKWREHEHGIDPWDPPFTFSSGNQSTRPRDYLTRSERTAIREAALSYGEIPSYESLNADERDR